MALKEQINQKKIPRHIAVIMDGNGRWAAQHGHQRIFGHRNGIESVRQTVEAAGELGIEYLTLYSFSTENWKRPKAEINGLMYLLGKAIANETQKLHQNNVRLQVIGNMNDLPPKLQQQLRQSIDTLSKNTGLTLVLALSYSGRWEISEAMQQIAHEVQKGNIDPENIDSALIESFLHTSSIPDPELLIRTSGEQRISNFLLWQLAYTELHFTPVLWPDFRKEHFYEAILDFQRRERRFGKVLITDSLGSA
ncbi:MAG: isoprenyl transferase [Bacteroidetes bacterium]|nr:isoprenyl transferase [Bacteroidota bacterium]